MEEIFFYLFSNRFWYFWFFIAITSKKSVNRLNSRLQAIKMIAIVGKKWQIFPRGPDTALLFWTQRDMLHRNRKPRRRDQFEDQISPYHHQGYYTLNERKKVGPFFTSCKSCKHTRIDPASWFPFPLFIYYYFCEWYTLISLYSWKTSCIQGKTYTRIHFLFFLLFSIKLICALH